MLYEQDKYVYDFLAEREIELKLPYLSQNFF